MNMIFAICAASGNSLQAMLPSLIIMVVILAALVIAGIVFTVLTVKGNIRGASAAMLLGVISVATVIVLVCTILSFTRYADLKQALNATTNTTATTGPTTEPTTEPATEPSTEPPTEPDPTFEATNTDNSNPNNWKVKWEIIQNGSVVNDFKRLDTITFGDGAQYAALDGVFTFRGDNYRSGASFGTVNVVNNTLTKKWESKIGSLKGDNGNWTGCGWTGQPLIVRWDPETREIMNLRPEKKAKADLVEVIYATLDGHIYFYDLDDGSYTRDPINVGMSFKGAGALDPRGYPLLYVGSGDNRSGSRARMYIISLVEGKVIYEQSGKDKDIKRGWYAFDSSPLVSAEADTLIWPGENGLLYTIKLNTKYDKAAGTITIDPENVVKTRYSTNTGHKIGCESSAIVVGSYVYYADNGGMFFCVDLNTMELKWAQYTRDDVNATPVFQWGDDGKGYIYTGTSMEYAKGTVYLHKLDAATGEILWEKKYTDVVYNEKVSGGVLSSPIIGKKGTDLEGLVIFSIARTPTAGGGTLVALNTQTGEVVWENTLKNYCWSSPVAVYTAEGKSYFVQCDSAGRVTLYEGKTGTALGNTTLGSNIEASPAIFENTIVVGTRGQKVFGITIE